MSQPLIVTLSILLVLSSSLWIGGYVAIAVVAMAARTSLEPKSRVALFRALGRSFLWVGGPALVVAIISGFVLLDLRGWHGPAHVATALAAALVALLVVAVAQARHMTRLRHMALEAVDDVGLQQRVRTDGRTAGVLRGLLGLLSLALVVVGCLLATS